MTTRHIAVGLAALLLAGMAAAQSAADLLQQGIHAQETAGDLDGAIRIFRQVASGTNKPLASQAQYQLVLCLLQKGDRTGAAKEAQALEQNFPDQKDLIAKARRVTEAGESLLPAPWGERESSQLNIKRDGAPTGEYLFYSVDPELGNAATRPNPQLRWLTWELKTKNSARTVQFLVDRDTMQPVTVSGREGRMDSTDAVGDAAVEPLIGPAIDVQASVFRMRRLPLAVGYKTTLTGFPLAIGQTAPRKFEVAVTGIEAVQTPSGKYNCYRVSIAPLHQTFWFAVDAARSLVKIQSGNVEAELVKVWGAEDVLEAAIAPFRAAGWKEYNRARSGPGASSSVDLANPDDRFLRVDVRIVKTYTPPADISEALRRAVEAESARLGPEYKVAPGGLQQRTQGGQQTISCVWAKANAADSYILWIRTENTAAKFDVRGASLGVARWKADQILSTVRIP
jgi:hypothetical protein